jgi:decaprenyl-phosphate phosphoribosyltransferase
VTVTVDDLPTQHPGTGLALVRGVRPRQWVKNLLVVAAPLAAGRLTDRDVAVQTLVAVLSFCCASGAVYLVNDVADVEADRLHPRKRFRPLAAGALTERTALVAAAVLAVGAMALAALTGLPLVLLVAGYLLLQVAYAFNLKHQQVLDICVVASGFLIRAVAGGLASGLALSEWFLLVAGFGSLFIVAGKRYSELQTLGQDGGTRRTLTVYTPSYLRFIWSVAAGCTIMAYSLWAFEQQQTSGVAWHALSIAPFVVGVMRYAVDVDAGRAGEPEDIIWRDRTLQVVGALWLVLVCIGVWSA